MRWVFLVVGFGVGLVLGLALYYREAPRVLRSHVPVIKHVEHAPDSERREEPPTSSSDMSATPVVEPTGDLPVEDAEDLDGHGRIEVDFEGFDGERTAWVVRTTMSGSREEQDVYPEDNGTVARLDVVPEVCDVWWLVGPRRVGVRVRVVAGRLVRVRAADFDFATIPRDLAVLGIHVGASWAGSLPFFGIAIEGADNRLRLRTNRHGCVNVTLRPAEVSVRVGDQVTPVALVAGRETVLEVRHEAEGDVLFDPPRAGGAGRIGLRPVGERRATARARYNLLGRDGFLYVKAGEYEVFRIFGRAGVGGTVLGTVRIHAGRASVFRVELPPGVLEISVELPEERARKTLCVLVSVQSVVRLRPFGATAGQGGYGVRSVDHVQAVRVALDGRHVYPVRIDGLHPGKYRLTCGTARETVEVGEGVTQVVLRPPR